MNDRPRILVDNRWVGHQGIARFGSEVIRRLPNVEFLPDKIGLFNPIDPLWLSWSIRRANPTIYFSPGFNPPLRSKVPFVFVIHDLNYIDCRENSEPLRRAYFNYLVKPACKRAAKVITVSNFSKNRIIDWGELPPDRIEVVGGGIGAEFSPQGEKADIGCPYILYVGNKLPHKNLPRLLFAIAKAKLDCRLLLTGRPDTFLNRLADQLGASHMIRFVGAVTDVELAKLYRGARAVVLPSLYEGFGLPIVEAMASGVPVLTSNITSMPEIAGEAALLVNPLSVDDIADGIQKIVSDNELRSTLVKLGLKQVERFNWDNTAAKILAVLQKESNERRC